MSKLTNFRPRIRSRHPSHDILRSGEKNLPLFPFKSVIRLGSTTDMRDTVTNGGNRIEINTINAIKNSANKLLMKECFTENNVKTADWFITDGILMFKQSLELEGEESNEFELGDLNYPIISKHIYGSRGTGNTKHDSKEDLEEWMEGKNLENYIFEEFKNYVREYRLHITKDGCFYTCRKMLKRDTPQEHKWYRNDNHCVWILEENELFDKPTNWDEIVKQSISALNSVGLDIGAVDVKIQSSTDSNGELRTNPKFIIIEINSAPSFGDNTSIKYLEELPKLLMTKYNNHE